MREWSAQLTLLLAAASSAFVSAKKHDPTVKHTPFKAPINNIVYFDNSDTILFNDYENTELWRTDDAGFTWDVVKEVEGAIEVIKHPYDEKIAILIGEGTTHYITKNRGKDWAEFETPYEANFLGRPVSFHATDPDRILFHTSDCSGLWDCTSPIYYTTDGFDSKPELLLDDAFSCLWAKSTEQFTTGDKKLDDDRIVCNVQGEWSWRETDSRILISDDFFATHDEPLLDDDRPVSGIISIASVTGYLAAAAKSTGSSELALYITKDTITWHLAEFGDHIIEQTAYTILESTNYSVQIDVMPSYLTPSGTLFTSNSNGTYFTKNLEHTNRNMEGYVDFEKVQNIQGIVMVNVIDNYEEIEEEFIPEKDIVTRISFDDGRTWSNMSADGEALHLHSVTDQINTGRVFSSPAPGIVMGVGNTGDSLKERKKGDTYISDDAGLTWNLTLKGPHLYEMGNQGALLVAIEDVKTDVFKYSINHGHDWEEGKLDHKVVPLALTTMASATSLKFIIVADDAKTDEHEIIALDFSSLKEKSCGGRDFEQWYARVGADGEPQCIMGHTTSFHRRKPDADCFIDEDSDINSLPEFEVCKCTADDYECDYNFHRENGSCVPTEALQPPKGECENDDDTYLGPSGYRLIPGNTCEDGKDLADPVERKCKGTKSATPSGEINATMVTFPKSKAFTTMYYLERCESCKGDDETIIALTDNDDVWLTHDHGKNWEHPSLGKDKITRIYPHQYSNDQAFLVTDKKKVWYTNNRGQSFHHFDAPAARDSSVMPLSFHPNQTDWMIWTGNDDDRITSYVSKKKGDKWEIMLRDVTRCEFIYREGRPSPRERVYCEQLNDDTDETGTKALKVSDNWFETHETLEDNIVSFASMSEFIVVAVKDEEHKTLRLDASIDGTQFAEAHFPRNFQVPHQTGYTVLSSSTHSILVHVTVNAAPDYQYGALIKSNSNGTEYVMNIRGVNRNNNGYVDFEKVQGLEGVAVVNIVANTEEVEDGSEKKLQTMITHNDGAEWQLMGRPVGDEMDSDWCRGGDDCNLHIHGYTERLDPRDTYSSPTAIGMMMAHGNVGEYLEDIKDADTFISRDAGVTWSIVEHGRWAWKYGDRGSVIVIAKMDEPIDLIKYTLDEGRTWAEEKISNQKIELASLTTVPSDTSLQFLITGRLAKGGDLATINIDFSGLEERSERCVLNDKDPEDPKDDYDLWSPEHPLMDDNCLFGHVSRYLRKNVERNCYNGKRLQNFHSIEKDCPCSRSDFECAYNYQPMGDGSCHLVEGLQAEDPQSICSADSGIKEYHEITPYRKVPLSTCVGGKALDGATKPCPGFENDPDVGGRGISGVGLFFAIVLPILAAAGIGWYVWRNWDGKFGRIQLGDGAAGSRIGLGGAFDRDAPWIKYPVLAVSGVVAVIAAIPLLVSSIVRTVQTRFGRSGGRYGSYGALGGNRQRPFTRRDDFSRSRGNYSVVDPDEGELLGDESEDEE